jgi:thymidylate synthase|tara:strand:+ start:347 stop:1012 length:666 start_codon:yes stop_codon:yes gene_type:complete
MNIADIRNHFIIELINENYTTDRNGSKTIELLGASFIANEEAIFGTPNRDYIESELEWYESESTNINDIYGTGFDDKKPPQAWRMTANQHGEINSNYGHLIYSDKYHTQYDQVLIELTNNPDSRRASMIYTRPSIWIEYNENGKNDFICTNSVTYYIRDHALHCVVQMRSNDVIFGYRNDYAWQDYVLRHLANDLSIDPGDIHWQVQNLHVYERHFDMVKS